MVSVALKTQTATRPKDWEKEIVHKYGMETYRVTLSTFDTKKIARTMTNVKVVNAVEL